MEIEFSDHANADLIFWKTTGNVAILKKIRSLLEAIVQSPFEGIGKPEPLKHSLSGTWSRRINREHRLIYEVKNNKIIVMSLKGHY